MQLSAEDAIWVADEKNCWVKGVLLKIKDDTTDVEVKLEDGCIQTIAAKGILPRNTTLTDERIDDLTELTHLHEASVLNALKCRYDEGEIYTYSGLVLAAINPYRQLPIYNREVIWAYNGRTRDELAPHLFAVVEESYRSLKDDRQSQSIIVSGESGAGKTISAKYIMRYLAELCVQESPFLINSNPFQDDDKLSSSVSLESRILATNPILEAFGNAKTVKNDNSSRFGKYIQIFFDSRDCSIRGALIRSYLLEKTRVISQAPLERNFHIFYQLLAGCPEAEKTEYGLHKDLQFRYLCNSNSTIDGVNDAEEFEQTRKALKTTGFTEDHQWQLFRILIAILFLGNIEFQENEKGYAILDKGKGAAEKVADLLGLAVEDLKDALLKRTITVAHETVETFNTVIQAETTRDVFSKHLYSRLFDHIINHLNTSLSPANEQSLDTMRFIGVLDIYGFEKFEQNSFEQFCINYANEKLQSMFNTYVFDLEQKLYTEEGIKWSFIDFSDNRPCIDLIEAKMGIFDLLDEECRFPNGSDVSFVNKLLEYHRKADKTADHKTNDDRKTAVYLEHNKLSKEATFIVKHFAYDVEYSGEHFLEKNRDHITPETFLTLVSKSSHYFLREIFEEGSSSTGSKDSSTPQTPLKASKETLALAQKHSTGSLFRQSLKELMTTLYSTRVHYIRCIKPNEDKMPFYFNPPFVLQQLRACGIIETIRISASGFPGRWSFDDFISRFSILAINPLTIRQVSDLREACRLLLAELDLKDDEYQIGRTRIFMRTGIVAGLEKARTRKLYSSATTIQTTIKSSLGRKGYMKFLQAAILVDCMVRMALARFLIWKLKKEKASTCLQSHHRKLVAIKQVQKLWDNIASIKAIFLRFRSQKNLHSIMEENAAQCMENLFKACKAQRALRKSNWLATILWSLLKRRQAIAQLRSLRAKAHSYSQLKRTADQKDEIIAKLQAQLKLADDHLAYEKSMNASLNEKINKLTEQLEASTNSQKSSLENSKIINDAAITEDIQDRIASYQRLISQLEANNEELFRRNDELTKQLRLLRLEQNNAEILDASNSKKQSLSNIVVRQSSTPPKTIRYLRSISFDSKVSRVGELSLPSITRHATIKYRRGDKMQQVRSALDNPLCLTELLQVVSTANTTMSNDFGPSHIFSLWISSWLSAESDNEIVQSSMVQIIMHIKQSLMGSAKDYKRSSIDQLRPLDSDAKFSYWLANLFDFLCSLQYSVIDIMEQQATFESSPSDRVVVLMQLRTDIARVVEDLCRIWLNDLFRSVARIGVSALLDYQGLSGFSSEQESPMLDGRTSSSLKLFMLPFSRLTGPAPVPFEGPSIEDLISSLNRLASAMETSQLPSELAMQVMSAVLSNISACSFNQLILRKNYATWKRGIQIQYNISRLEEWATLLNSNHPQYYFTASALASPLGGDGSKPTSPTVENPRFSSTSPLTCIEPLVQAVKLLQLAKTRAANDVDTLIAACPRLSLAQIRKILSIYVSDAYEDGPVAPAVLQTLTKRLTLLPRSDLAETLPETQPQVLPLQLSIKPKPTAEFSELPSDVVPAHLWKIFALTNSQSQKERMNE